MLPHHGERARRRQPLVVVRDARASSDEDVADAREHPIIDGSAEPAGGDRLLA